MSNEDFKPNHGTKCENCEQTPTVVVIVSTTEEYNSGLCGPCYFGTARALDSDEWDDC